MSRRPPNPYFVLAMSLILPGTGHVLMGVPQRGLMFLFFIIVLGWAGANIMPADASFVGRYIGGIFVYGLSVLDAYKLARIGFTLKFPAASQPPGD